MAKQTPWFPNIPMSVGDKQVFDAKVELYRAGVQKIVDAHYKEQNYTFEPPPLAVAEPASRYYRIWLQSLIWRDSKDHSLGSVPATQNIGGGVWKPNRQIHTFLDSATGDVLKPASWKAPAKHARGNLFDESNGLARVTHFGPEYLR